MQLYFGCIIIVWLVKFCNWNIIIVLSFMKLRIVSMKVFLIFSSVIEIFARFERSNYFFITNIQFWHFLLICEKKIRLSWGVFFLIHKRDFWHTYIPFNFQVARAIRNPFGDDLDDFSIGPLTSRHIWVSKIIRKSSADWKQIKWGWKKDWTKGGGGSDWLICSAQKTKN